MNFDYSEEQQLLAESVRRFVEKDYTFEARKRIVDSPSGWSESVWKSMADIGLLGIPLPAEHGGFGGTAAAPKDEPRDLGCARHGHAIAHHGHARRSATSRVAIRKPARS